MTATTYHSGDRHADRLHGESGRDTFTGDETEVRDLVATSETTDELRNAAPSTDAANAEPFVALDPIVKFNNPWLEAVVADALGVAVTRRYDGQPLVPSGGLRQSQVASLTDLDASLNGTVALARLPVYTSLAIGTAQISNLTGLEYAISLRSLNLHQGPRPSAGGADRQRGRQWPGAAAHASCSTIPTSRPPSWPTSPSSRH